MCLYMQMCVAFLCCVCVHVYMCMCALCLCVWEGERACVSVNVPMCIYVCVQVGQYEILCLCARRMAC